jgi:hypothetical protein
LLHSGPTGLREMSDEKLIEPLAGIVRCDRNRDGKLIAHRGLRVNPQHQEPSARIQEGG